MRRMRKEKSTPSEESSGLRLRGELLLNATTREKIPKRKNYGKMVNGKRSLVVDSEQPD